MKKNESSILDMLTHQYNEEIQEVILESEHHYKSELDLISLNDKLDIVFRSAITDGLPEELILQMIEHKLPQCFHKLHFRTKNAA
jgi:hypothetical protein